MPLLSTFGNMLAPGPTQPSCEKIKFSKKLGEHPLMHVVPSRKVVLGLRHHLSMTDPLRFASKVCYACNDTLELSHLVPASPSSH